MRVELDADEAAIRAAVGPETFLRGRDYARGGAVRDLQLSDGGRVAIGRVDGSARHPYIATVIFERDTRGALARLEGRCTCPVGWDCKHTAAVALVATARESKQPRIAGGLPATTDWAAMLDAVTRSSASGAGELADGRLGAAQVALQFETVRDNARGLASVLLRPVVPGRTGWVRTGVSWNHLGSLRYSRQPGVAERAQLLDELALLYAGTHPARHLSYGYGEQRFALESFGTRRVWDLFDEMRASGLPFVGAGRAPAAVELHTDPATIAFDLSSNGSQITVAPQVMLDGTTHATAERLLLGRSAHGLAWIGQDGALNLARLRGNAVADAERLLAVPTVTVPDTERHVLLADYLPRLRRVATVVSCDGSVALPDAAPPVLGLHVEHLDGHRLELTWTWIYAEGSAHCREALWPSRPGDQLVRDVVEERALMQPVVAIVQVMPDLFDRGRLTDTCELSGLATASFVGQLLPALEALPGLRITREGESADYHEAYDEPVITFAGKPKGRDWFDFEVSVSVDGQEVPFVDLFQALAREDPCLILSSGTYFSLDRPEFIRLARLIEESRTLLDAPSGTVRVGRLQAGVWDELDRLGIVSAQADAWRGAARALSTVERIAEQPVPSGLQARLRSYQLDGFNWLAFLFEHGLGGVLADEMGLGKTLQVLALIGHAREKGLSDAPFLVVAPTSVVHNWLAETQRFTPGLTARAITETGRRRALDLAEATAEADLVVTSYTLFRLEHDQYAALPWAGLILDEAQFAKNHRSLAYECVKKLDVAFKLAVTGTPLENNLMELWSLLSITAPGLFPAPRPFEEYYRWPVERQHDSGRLDQLRARVRPLMLRRTKSQVLADLPDKQEQILELDLNPRHRKIYQTHLQRERQKVLGLLGDIEKNRFAIFRSLTLLRQACLDPALVDPAHTKIPATKLDVLLDQLTEVAAEGHRAVVFSQFTRFLDSARSRLDRAGIEYCYLDGKTKNRAEVVAQFKTGAAPVFLVSLRAGGFGLTLTEADYCFLLDPWWNPATEAQAVDRLHRIGQIRKVMVYRMVARDTIEEKVMALKAGKAALFDSVMDARGVTSGRLTAADIRGLLS